MRTFLILCFLSILSFSTTTIFAINKIEVPETVNAVIGDRSFIETFGITPTMTTSEKLRIQTHLDFVEKLLRKSDVSGLSLVLQKRRLHLLDKLREYRLAGIFPINTAFHKRRPCFIDEQGSICAVGYLIEQSVGREVAKNINTAYQYEYVYAMNLPELTQWVAQSGLTFDECAMIQPQYDGSDGNFSIVNIEPYVTTATGKAFHLTMEVVGNKGNFTAVMNSTTILPINSFIVSTSSVYGTTISTVVVTIPDFLNSTGTHNIRLLTQTQKSVLSSYTIYPTSSTPIARYCLQIHTIKVLERIRQGSDSVRVTSIAFQNFLDKYGITPNKDIKASYPSADTGGIRMSPTGAWYASADLSRYFYIYVSDKITARRIEEELQKDFFFDVLIQGSVFQTVLTSIKEPNYFIGGSSGKMTVFPSIADDYLEIDYQGASMEAVMIELFNSYGQKVMEVRENIIASEYRKALPCTRINSGAYLLRFTAHLTSGRDVSYGRKILISR